VSRARPIYPGDVIFSTRRVHKRQLLLRPSDAVNQAIQYIVAVIAQRYEIQLHAICAMSNHLHQVASDLHARRVEFDRDCHALLARIINALHGEFESLWAREPTCRVSCVEQADVLDKIAYTMANPVEARLVAHGRSWPGVRRAWTARPRTIRRPDWFFRDEENGGAWPDEVTLELHRPPGYEHLSDAELAAHLAELIERREADARQTAREAGASFLGRRGVLAQSRHGYPATSERRFGLRPTVAARSRWARIEKLLADRDWLERYQVALARLNAGARSVLFPFGTWKLRVYYHQPCEPPPPTCSPVA
jgi:REP element-mobilizing transposase RayT